MTWVSKMDKSKESTTLRVSLRFDWQLREFEVFCIPVVDKVPL